VSVVNTASRWLEPLHTAPVDSFVLGGKGASLARLVALGHPVPPGFVITVPVYLAMLEVGGVTDAHEELGAALSRGEPRFDLADRIAAAIDRSPYPPGLADDIASHAAGLGLWEDQSDGLIVRSSATVEDSASSSFAGIFESTVITDPASLDGAIRAVWRSTVSRRALTYAVETGADAAPLMAVVVQKFLEATRAGVMFTTFDGATLVEHVEGGCEKLVLGEVIPERLRIDLMSGTTEGSTSGLDHGQVAGLAALATRLEKEFGGPQDVEWVVWRDRIHLVQTRPITTSLATIEPSPIGNALLSGIAASGGVGSGPSHLVFNIDQALRLEHGAVLVTPMTNPDMVVAMRASAGIVTDVGGVICHAAIVSRELRLPCVVGTETATTTLAEGQMVTVDGSAGAVYDGVVEVAREAEGPPAEWEDVWTRFQANRPGIPLVPGIAALEAAPPGEDAVVLLADIDLRSSPQGMWNDLEHFPESVRTAIATAYLQRVRRALDATGVHRVGLLGEDLPPGFFEPAVAAAHDDRISIVTDSGEAVAITEALAVANADRRVNLPVVAEAVEAATDTAKFFGHTPAVRRAAMPDPGWRGRWWSLLPEYGRFHQEFTTAEQLGDHDWLEIRPELVISPLLKSLVQPGFEMVPRAMGFSHLPPLYVKWIRCRYHFRADAFTAVWEAIVRATWNPAYMADLNRRVRRSYDQLGEVLVLFPAADGALRKLTEEQMVALLTSWWPRWVEFFALCWFIQAQGDDILYPFIEETVTANRTATGGSSGDVVWPSAADLVLPTTPVLSGDYMASVGRLRREMLESGLDTAEAAVAAVQRGEVPGLAEALDRHLADWHWMRDRDLLFEPWDTPQRVLETALGAGPHTPVPYEENLRRNLFGLGFHAGLARASGRHRALAYAVRNLHDLNVERENHHVLWLKYSYPLRRVFLELERRFIEQGHVEAGDIWYFEAPELIDLARALPEPPDEALVAKVRNRRRGFEHEARLTDGSASPPHDEDDYY
jgi:phosphohistidine swiveling domain-containing protein